MKIAQIPDSEWQVMKALWRKNPLTAADIVSEVQKEYQWKDLTIRTLIRRLIKKGAVTYTIDPKDARIFYYEPVVSHQECMEYEKKNFMQKTGVGKMGLLIASFIDGAKLSDEEIDGLYRILKEKREQND